MGGSSGSKKGDDATVELAALVCEEVGKLVELLVVVLGGTGDEEGSGLRV